MGLSGDGGFHDGFLELSATDRIVLGGIHPNFYGERGGRGGDRKCRKDSDSSSDESLRELRSRQGLFHAGAEGLSGGCLLGSNRTGLHRSLQPIALIESDVFEPRRSVELTRGATVEKSANGRSSVLRLPHAAKRIQSIASYESDGRRPVR